MDVILKPSAAIARKHKRKTKTKVTTSEPKNIKLDTTESIPVTTVKAPKTAVKRKNENDAEDYGDRYPIFKDEELVSKFLKVPMSNNQKGNQ